MTTLATSLTADAVDENLFAYGPRIDFSTAISGTERTALSFISPPDYYRCELNVSLDSGSWSAGDLMSIVLKINSNNIYQAKWAVNATTLGQPQMISPLSIIMAPETLFEAILAFSSSVAMVGSGSVILTGTRRL